MNEEYDVKEKESDKVGGCNEKWTDERVLKLAQRMMFLLFSSVAALVMMIPLSACKRFEVLVSDVGLVLLVVGLIVVIAIIMILHCGIFPKQIEGYDDYANGIKPGAPMSTKRRLIGAAIIFVTLCIMVVLTNLVFWPIGTVPREIPKTLFYSKDGERILDGDFGTVAAKLRDTAEKEFWWVCSSIDAYGPFEYGGEDEEIRIFRRTDTSVEAGGERGYVGLDEMYFIFFCHYEDGDWMIIKRFEKISYALEANLFKITDENDGLFVVNELIEEGKISYEVVELGDSVNILKSFDAITLDVLKWEETDGSITWRWLSY